jgi:uncharacterized glyoxalase superfamily protein PhnB
MIPACLRFQGWHRHRNTSGRRKADQFDRAAVYAQAVAAGASEVVPSPTPMDGVSGRIVDPFGHDWEIGRRLT